MKGSVNILQNFTKCLAVNSDVCVILGAHHTSTSTIFIVQVG